MCKGNLPLVNVEKESFSLHINSDVILAFLQGYCRDSLPTFELGKKQLQHLYARVSDISVVPSFV